MASTTFREPVQRDVSDEVFRRITGVTAYHYLRDEQLRFLLINEENPQEPVRARRRHRRSRAAEGRLPGILRVPDDSG